MNLQEVFDEMERFKAIIEHELKVFNNIDYDAQDPNEQFLLAHAYSIESEMQYIVESIDYIRKPVMLSGTAYLKEGIPFIDDFELFESDVIEFLLDNEWQRADIYKINGNFMTDFLKNHSEVPARIRMTKEEADERLSA